MWMVAMFDLPVVTKEEKRNYTRFRKRLQNEGFMRMQYSVYISFCTGEDEAKNLRKRVRAYLPPDGEVRLITITDRQFGKMEVYWERKRESPEKPPQQLMLF